MKRFIFYFSFCFLVFQAAASANPGLEAQVQELARMVHELSKTVALQQKEIEFLKGERQVTVSQPAVQAERAAPSTATAGRWNPDIGVIADVVFQHNSPKADDGTDRVSVRELELVMGSYVDPYSRLDLNIAFSDFEDVHIQEAYLTRFGLPWELTARVGRFKPKAGKALLFHRDILDTADYPLVIQRYFGEDGLPIPPSISRGPSTCRWIPRTNSRWAFWKAETGSTAEPCSAIPAGGPRSTAT